MQLTSRLDADHQTALRVQHARLGIWLSAGGFLVSAVRIGTGTGWSGLTTGLFLASVGAVAAQLLPIRTMVSSRYADPVWGALLGLWAIGMLGYAAVDEVVLSGYPALAALLIGYSAAVFSPGQVFWVGGPLVAAYPLVAARAEGLDPPFVIAITVIQAVTVALGVGIARHRGRRDTLRLRAERRAEALLRQSSEVLLAVEPGGEISYQSTATSAVLGYPPGELTGTPLLDLLHPGDQRTAGRWLGALAAAADGHAARIETRIRRADGRWTHAEIAGTNRLADPDFEAISINVRDVGTRKELEARLTRQAFRDALTGLANRALLRDRVEHAVERGRRSASTVALFIIDLDGFKIINDSCGQARGDELLVAIADRLAGYIRPSDTLARLGADEFALLVEDRIDADSAVVLGERLLAAIRKPIDLGTREISLTASAGIAVAKVGVSGANDAEELLRDADLAGYAAKGQGGDRCVLFDPAMHVEILREAEHRADLESAFAEEQFTVQYQPIVDLPTLRMVGVEALVRWQHPIRGVLAPTEFIPLAESTGLIVPIGRWVLHQACRQLVTWQRTIPGAENLRVSVNLSARQFQYPELVSDVAAILRSTGVNPARVVLEITESLLMLDTEATVATLYELKDLGVRLAIDDFGTGYSSLSYLRRFPVDIIKIDRSFVDGLTTDTEDATLTEAVVQLGRSLRLQTIAEGIETKEQSARLKDLGCEFGQGFLFARPVTAADLEPMLALAAG